MCYTGLSGDSCNELCSYGQWTIATAIIDLILGIFLFCFAMVRMHSTISTRKNGTHRPWPLLCTLTFSGGGSVLFAAQSIASICSVIGFPALAVVSVQADGRQIRRIPPSADLASFLLYGIAGCIGVCSLFVLPLTWVCIDSSFHAIFCDTDSYQKITDRDFY
jgi:hypothetical protein